MNIKVNGEVHSVEVEISIKGLLDVFAIKPEAVVVEHNLKIIGKELWETTILQENDSIEIVRFVGGG
ncbi:MAG: sulfur carrier protein ThiS [Candidatus Riflemargulisbacteria bacterium]